MKLSDAILLGSTVSEQAFGIPYGGNGGRCALATACEAEGSTYSECGFGNKFWPWIYETQAICPVCGTDAVHIGFVIATHLNDIHRWTREQIAEWVATIEPKEEIPSVPVGEYCDVHQEASKC